VIPRTPHHIVLRGNNRRVLFSSKRDHEMFLFFVWRALERGGCGLHAATLMSNHVHLLLTPADAGALAQFVKAVAQRYAQLRNQKRGSSGKLFEERFFSRPVLTERQVAIVTAYIHANPVRSGNVADALDYPWSMHALHAGRPEHCAIPPTFWDPSDWYAALADAPWRRAERYLEAYDEYLQRAIEPEHVSDLQIREAISQQAEILLRRPDGTRATELLGSFCKNQE
jgi:putative transposase